MKKWHIIILEWSSLFLAVFFIHKNNPAYEGAGVVGAATGTILVAALLSCLFWFIRLLWDRNRKYDSYMNTIWVVEFILYLSFIRLGEVSFLCIVPFIILFATWILIRSKSFYIETMNNLPKISQTYIPENSPEGESIVIGDPSLLNVPPEKLRNRSYFYSLDGKKVAGPLYYFSLVRQNIKNDTLVWYPGLPGWTPAAYLSEFRTVLNNDNRISPNQKHM